MRFHIIVVIGLISFFISFLQAAPSILVAEFQESQAITSESAHFSKKLIERLSLSTNYNIINQSDIVDKVSKQYILTLDPSNIKTLIKVGKAAGTEYLIAGKIDRIGDRIMLLVNFVDIQKGDLLLDISELVIGNDSLLYERIPNIVSRISDLIPEISSEKSIDTLSNNVSKNDVTKTDTVKYVETQKNKEYKTTSLEDNSHSRMGIDLDFALYLGGTKNQIGPELKLYLLYKNSEIGLSGSYGRSTKYYYIIHDIGVNQEDATYIYFFGGGFSYLYNFHLINKFILGIGAKGGYWYESSIAYRYYSNGTNSLPTEKYLIEPNVYYAGLICKTSINFSHVGFNVSYSPLFGNKFKQSIFLGISLLK
jgi:TolB-like protein